jgi:hypothetical protein
MSGRRIVRFSLDLEAEQRNFVRLFALKNGINASVVMRALLYTLETDPNFANSIIDLIFEVPEEEVETEEFEESAPAPADDAAVETVSVMKISDLKSGDFLYDVNGNRVIVE